ncbi:hypothetical protein LSH36_113g05009 [Paralvinella palmiformis]|uniref:Alternative oxidase n=1 Tax=Paralvinella palmiformis TaxID=53620 RepID=A0AAD9JYL7_9ANNE|nr:hypothetical protein LSH36_113g05009 [Paralvinella palmiformis]
MARVDMKKAIEVTNILDPTISSCYVNLNLTTNLKGKIVLDTSGSWDGVIGSRFALTRCSPRSGRDQLEANTDEAVKPISLLQQLQKGSYGIAPQISRSFCHNQTLLASAAAKRVPNSDDIHESGHSTMDQMISARIEEVRTGKFDKMNDPEKLAHFRTPAAVEQSSNSTSVSKDDNVYENYTMPHPIWSQKEVHSVRVTHKTPQGINDWLAYMTIKSLRVGYDIISGYNRRTRDEALWLNRIVFLETVAGVPGMVAAMVRHLYSLRKMRRDHGWIHTLLEEAENERMHLMTALQLKQPSLMFKGTVLAAQGMFVTWFSVAYMIAPRYCHRFVGYLEEEAVVTYTKCLKDIEDGAISHWQTKPAPQIAVKYWNLAPTATMKDVILAIRADEAHHRVVNHTLASMNKYDFNPYKPGE